jgi:hypothetical protein
MTSFSRYILMAALLVTFAAGCGSSPSTTVLDGEVAKDPSLVGQDNTVTGGDPLAPEAKPAP